ncbi:MAG: lipopolysaccharide assembly protein LapB [Gammaproteobacteria bacterium]
MIELLWLLLPVAAASGWWLAKREPDTPFYSYNNNSEYFKGLNYLLDDKPDQAIEVFTRMVEMDKDTVETHMTLGNLFRRRGEVDRAIHIHHNLMSRANLTAQQRSRAMLELAEDYMRAGLFDRAENLYRALAEYSEHTVAALHRLLDIYEQEKDWEQAIAHCDRLERMTGQVRKLEAAHYCCELAEAAMRHGDSARAQDYLKQALQRDANCARASLLHAQIAMAGGDCKSAVAHLQAVERQNPNFFTEIIAPLGQCYAALNRQSELLEYLRNVHQHDHSGRFTAVLAELLAQQEGASAAIQFLEQELREYPSFIALRYLVELKIAHKQYPQASDIETLYRTSKHMLNGAARYRCDNCGFIGKSLHWHCPSCKRWSTIKPLPDLVCKHTA